MERGSDKSSMAIDRQGTIEATFDLLAILSVVAVLTGAILTVAGAGWKTRAYISIVAFLFDVIFTYEAFTRLAARQRPFPWLALISSILPLLAVSGPFISGWLEGDLGAAAVRGFWLGQPPTGGLATLAALRLLRIARPFMAGRTSQADSQDSEIDKSTTQRASGCALAAGIGIAVALAGAIASDAMILPGLAEQAAARRQSVFQSIEKAGRKTDLAAMAKAAGVLALKADGQVLLAAPSPLSPSEYSVVSSSTLEAWFPATEERRTRGWAEIICALASMAAATAYAIAAFRFSGSPEQGHRDTWVWTVLRGRGRTTRSLYEKASSYHDRPEPSPTGTEELAGILGKRTR
jgi:hypothetical protein